MYSTVTTMLKTFIESRVKFTWFSWHAHFMLLNFNMILSSVVFFFSGILYLPELLSVLTFSRQARLLLPPSTLSQSLPSWRELLRLCLRLEHAEDRHQWACRRTERRLWWPTDGPWRQEPREPGRPGLPRASEQFPRAYRRWWHAIPRLPENWRAYPRCADLFDACLHGWWCSDGQWRRLSAAKLRLGRRLGHEWGSNEDSNAGGNARWGWSNGPQSADIRLPTAASSSGSHDRGKWIHSTKYASWCKWHQQWTDGQWHSNGSDNWGYFAPVKTSNIKL